MLRLSVRRRLCSTVAKPDIKSGAVNSEATPSIKSAKSENGGVPWSLVAILAFIGGIGSYFYRGSKNGGFRDEEQTRLKHSAALDKDEVEEIRSANNMPTPTFELIKARAVARFQNQPVESSTFFSFCDSLLGGRGALEMSDGLKAGHLFERLSFRLEEVEKKSDMKTLFTALTMTLDNNIRDRMKLIFQIFTNSKKDDTLMTHQQLQEALQSLMSTYQLPTRTLTREITEYPFNRYIDSSPESLLRDAAEEILKQYKKDKTIKEGLDDTVVALKAHVASKDNNQQDILDIPNTPYWTLEDFENILYSRAVCVWGECNTKRSG